MFDLVVIPLMNVLAGEEMTPEERAEALKELQEALTEQSGHPVTWSEDVPDDTEFEADVIDPHIVYSLRAAAAWLETHDSIEGFEVGEEAWEHPALDIVEEEDAVKKFPQILQADASEAIIFVPADHADVLMIEMGEEEEDEEDEESEVDYFLMGSLPRLRAELDILKDALGIEDGLEEKIDDIVPDSTEDPLAAPRYAWVLLSARTNEAMTRALPLLLYFDEDEIEEDFDEELEGDVETN